MSLSSAEITELVSAADEITNAMSAAWREMLPLPFELEPFYSVRVESVCQTPRVRRPNGRSSYLSSRPQA